MDAGRYERRITVLPAYGRAVTDAIPRCQRIAPVREKETYCARLETDQAIARPKLTVRFVGKCVAHNFQLPNLRFSGSSLRQGTVLRQYRDEKKR